MILINLLPPELRRTRRQADPIFLGVAAAWIAVLLPAATWAWVHWRRIPAAQQALTAAQAELAIQTKLAEAVEKNEATISGFQKQHETLATAMAKKVYWAKTIDDLANHLGGGWEGFELCCTDLTIQPATMQAVRRPAGGAAPKKGEQVQYMVRGRFKILGVEHDKAGDYIKAFLFRTEASPFWKTNGFQGRPEETYVGDEPRWKAEISRTVIECTLNWLRSKEVVLPVPKRL